MVHLHRVPENDAAGSRLFGQKANIHRTSKHKIAESVQTHACLVFEKGFPTQPIMLYKSRKEKL